MNHDELVDYLNDHHGVITLKAQGFNWQCDISWWWKNSQSPIDVSMSEVRAYGPTPIGAMYSAAQLLSKHWAFVTEQTIAERASK